jgi:hypothetical protein
MSSTYVDGTTPLDAAHMNALQQKVEKGAASGYPSLDSGGKVPVAQLPAASLVPTVVNGQWLKGVGGAAVWSAITTDALSATPPGSPVDGQLWALPLTGGGVWLFRYNAGSASTYKWEFVGGPPLVSAVSTTESVAGDGGWHAGPTDGPSVQVPRAGEYLPSASAMLSGTLTGTVVSLGIFIAGGAAPADPLFTSAHIPAANYYIIMGIVAAGVLAPAASALIDVLYNGNAGTVGIQKRNLSVIPRRVS